MRAPLLDLAIIGNSRISVLIDREDDFRHPFDRFHRVYFLVDSGTRLAGRSPAGTPTVQKLLACRDRLGLLSEDIDIKTGEPWGNFPQTYSMVGIIMCAKRLSSRWDEAF
jgi:hypothetical protein